MALNTVNLNNIKAISEKYGVAADCSLYDNISKINVINNKYKLVDGSESDFNNAINFFTYATIKNSKKIDSNEISLSAKFGKLLTRYYNTNLSDTDLEDLFGLVYTYNHEILEDRYTLIKNDVNEKNNDLDSNNKLTEKGITKVINIFNDIFKMNPETFEIKDNSLASLIYNNIVNDTNYVLNIQQPTTFEIDYAKKLTFMILYTLLLNNKTNKTNSINDYFKENKPIGVSGNAGSEKPYFRLSTSYIQSIDYPIGISSTKYVLINNTSSNALRLAINEYGFGNEFVNPLYANNPIRLIFSTETERTFTLGEIDSITVTRGDQTYSLSSNDSNYYFIDNNNTQQNICKTICNSNKFGIKFNLSDIYDSNCSKVSIKYIDPISGNLRIKEYEFFNELQNNLLKNMQKIVNTEATLYNKMIFKYNSNIYDSITRTIVSSDYLNKYLDLYYLYYKIIFDINIIDKNTYTEKRRSDDVESYYLQKFYNLNIMSFNLHCTNKTSLNDAICKLYELNNGTGVQEADNYYWSVKIIYKEFNPVIRKIDLSNIQNIYLANIFNTHTSQVSNKLYSYIKHIKPIDNLITQDEADLFNNTYSNAAIIRAGADSDLIGYLSGDLIGYGCNDQENNEIDLLTKLYRETRDYFYKVLYNKAFMFEDMYDIYTKFFITAYTIERFCSYRLDNLKNIELFTESDCRNWLISYGLESLNTQIDNNKFTNAIVYKKRIIAYYNKLLSKKGSKAVIDELFKMFNYDSSSINIHKYSLVKVTDNGTSDFGFIELPYTTKNINYEINKNLAKLVPYEKFLNNGNDVDPYWTINDVPKNSIEPLITTPKNTKYIGIQLNKDVFNDYIKTKYAMSLSNYFFDKISAIALSNNAGISTLAEDTESDTSNTDNNPTTTEDTIENEFNVNKILNSISVTANIKDTQKQISIFALYAELNILYDLYIMFNEYRFGNKITPSNSQTTYLDYGINPDFKFTEKDDPELYSIFSAPILYIEKATLKFKKNIQYFLKTKKLMAPLLINEQSTLNINNISEQNITFDFLPLNWTSDKYYNDKYITLKNNTYENYTEFVLKDNLPRKYESIEALDECYSTISILNYLNGLDYLNDSATNLSDLNTIYKFNSHRNDDSPQYNVEDGTNNSSLLNSTRRMLNDIIDFPVKYLNGEFNTDKYTLTKNTKDKIDYIFNSFYAVPNKTHLTPVDDAYPLLDTNKINDTDNSNETIIEGYVNKLFNIVTTISNSEDAKVTIALFKLILEDLFVKTGIAESIESVNSDSELTSDKNNGVAYINIKTSESTSTNSYIKIKYNSLNDEAARNKVLTNIEEKIIYISDVIDMALSEYDNLKIKLNITEDISNFFEFVKESIKFFISYTTNLYSSDLLFTYETKNERPNFSYSIETFYEDNAIDYLYYDESITIERFERIKNEE